MTESVFHGGRRTIGFGDIFNPRADVCVVPLKRYQGAAVCAIGALTSGTLGSFIGGYFKHPVIGAISGSVIGSALIGTYAVRPPFSERSPEEIAQLQPLDQQ